MADTYAKTQWSNNATALSAENMNHIEQGISDAHDLIEQIVNSKIEEIILDKHPIGSIEINTTGTNPSAYLGGTWEAWGQGRVPVGVGTSDRAFNANETGGSSNAIIPAHTHTATFQGNAIAAHSHPAGGLKATLPNLSSSYSDFVHAPHAMSAYRGSINGSSSADYAYLRMAASGVSTRDLGRSGVSISGRTIDVTNSTDAAGGHTPSGSVTISQTGETVTDKNLQPYITCYMWLRTA